MMATPATTATIVAASDNGNACTSNDDDNDNGNGTNGRNNHPLQIEWWLC